MWVSLKTEQLIKIIPFFSFVTVFIFFVKRKNCVEQTPKISPEDKYKKSNKSEFLNSFQDSGKDKNYSENIDTVFYNREEYNKIIAEADNILEPKWKSRILYEFTPRGNIIMFYDAYKEGFAYYSDTQMTYDILNMAAIKYSILFRCRDFFIDEQQYPNGFISPLIKLKEDQDKKPASKKVVLEGPFIKSKKVASNLSVEPVTKIYSKNKFVYLGKTCNFSFLKKESRVKPVIETSYSSVFQGEKNAQRGVFDYRKFKELKSLG
jgi:hypothetical protein